MIISQNNHFPTFIDSILSVILPHFDPIASNSAEITEVSRYVFSFLFIFIHLFLVIFPNDPRATYY